MNYKKVEDFINESFEEVKMKEFAEALIIDENFDIDEIDFLHEEETYKRYDDCIKGEEYFTKLERLAKKMERRGVLKVETTTVRSPRDGHASIKGNLKKRESLLVTVKVDGTIRDLVNYAHMRGHIYSSLLQVQNEAKRESYAERMKLHNVLPILMEKIVLSKFGETQILKSYDTFRAYRLKAFSKIDTFLRERKQPFTQDTLDILVEEYGVKVTDIMDFICDIEKGNDPVYKAYSYYISSLIAKILFERKKYKEDIGVLMSSQSVDELYDKFELPKLKK